VVAVLAIVLGVALATFLFVFTYFPPVTRGAQLNAWPESRIVYPGARLVATETKDLAPQSWLVEDDTAELIKTYEVDASVAKNSIVAYYSRQLSELSWTSDTADTNVSAPDAGFCKLPNLAAFITFRATQSYTYTLKDIFLGSGHYLVCGS